MKTPGWNGRTIMNTIEIKGKVNTAICYAKVVEDEAIEQIRRMCDYPMTLGSKIRIMPDVHAGKGCTIGTTMTITCPELQPRIASQWRSIRSL